MNDLLALGQSVWLDYIRRGMVRGGELQSLIDRGLRGITSNPSIFEKAIAGSGEYDDDLRVALRDNPDATALELFEYLAVQDIRDACDLLRTVYDDSDGADGFVSLEVSPHLAYDRDGTIADAKRLWATVDRPNLMIKVPATPDGIEAFEELIAAGININATLMFSLAHYEGIAMAYVRGLARGADPARMASVASFFVSRVDTFVDKKLDAIGTAQAKALRGKAAIANAKLAYARYREIFGGEVFAGQRARGARPQRVLFGSTSTKDPAYSDVMYVDELIGPDTVNTVPPETLDAFLDHGTARTTLTEGVDEAKRTIEAIESLGIDFGEVTETLQVEGVKKFADSFDQMIAAIDEKRAALLEPAGRTD